LYHIFISGGIVGLVSNRLDDDLAGWSLVFAAWIAFSLQLMSMRWSMHLKFLPYMLVL